MFIPPVLTVYNRMYRIEEVNKLKRGKRDEILQIVGIFFSPEEVQELNDSVSEHGGIIGVILDRSQFYNQSYQSILAMKVNSLILTECYCQKSEINFVNLGTNNVLKSLYLSNNYLASEGIKKLCEALEVNTTLEHLDLQHNHIRNDDALALGNALKKHPKLRSINLSHNRVGSLGLMGLLFAPEDIETVIRHYDDCGLKELEVMSAPPPILENLDLSFPEDGGGIGWGAIAIAKALSDNKTSLKSIKLCNNVNLSLSGIICIFNALKYNQKLTTLNLSRTNQSLFKDASTEEIKTMFDFLKTNSALTNLDLSLVCGIGSDEVISLANALERNTTLKYLNLYGIRIDTPEGEMAIKKISRITLVNKITDFISLGKSSDSAEALRLGSYLRGGAGAPAGGGSASTADEGRSEAGFSDTLKISFTEKDLLCLAESSKSIREIIEIVSCRTIEPPLYVIKAIRIGLEKCKTSRFGDNIEKFLEEAQKTNIEKFLQEAQETIAPGGHTIPLTISKLLNRQKVFGCTIS